MGPIDLQGNKLQRGNEKCVKGTIYYRISRFMFQKLPDSMLCIIFTFQFYSSVLRFTGELKDLHSTTQEATIKCESVRSETYSIYCLNRKGPFLSELCIASIGL